MTSGAFAIALAWDALTQMLCAQLAGVDVAEISDRDFNQDDELIMTPPSVRSFFAGEAASSLSDSQRLSYNAVQRYILLCADENLASPSGQAMASLVLAERVKEIVIGARISLSTGDVSEPVTYVGCEPQPLERIGVAYAIAIEVPGLAQFPGTNANQDGPQ